jgi:hypothetical protein
MDYLDFAIPKNKFPACAKYYDSTVDDPSDGGQTFHFDYVDPLSKTYRTLFGNITSDRNNGEVAIRTRDKLPYKQSSYIIFPNGICYQIIQCQTDFNTANRQALRLFPVPAGVEYVIRMVQIPNPWGIV